jgi:TonB family protein
MTAQMRRGLLLLLLLGFSATNIALAGESPADAYRRGDYAKAFNLAKREASTGVIDAQIMLGQMYLRGEGVSPNPQEAIAWLTRAADAGSPLAAYDLGVFAVNGVGGSPDQRAAARWFHRSAHQGYPDAAYNLAVLYHNGEGVDRDDALSLAWIRAAIAYMPRGSAPSMKARFEGFRDTLFAVMTPEQVAAAGGILSPDAPVFPARILNNADLEKETTKRYPRGLAGRGRSGHVVVLILVRADGTYGDSVIESSSGYDQLDGITVDVLKQGRFVPRSRAGSAEDSWQIVAWDWKAHEASPYTFERMNMGRGPK